MDLSNYKNAVCTTLLGQFTKAQVNLSGVNYAEILKMISSRLLEGTEVLNYPWHFNQSVQDLWEYDTDVQDAVEYFRDGVYSLVTGKPYRSVVSKTRHGIGLIIKDNYVIDHNLSGTITIDEHVTHVCIPAGTKVDNVIRHTGGYLSLKLKTTLGSLGFNKTPGLMVIFESDLLNLHKLKL